MSVRRPLLVVLLPGFRLLSERGPSGGYERHLRDGCRSGLRGNPTTRLAAGDGAQADGDRRGGGRCPEARPRFREFRPRAADARPGRLFVRESTEPLKLAQSLITRFRDAVPDDGDSRLADAHDDELLSDEDAAALILGLQDRRTRDRAAEWMEAPDSGPALRLWRALARRCVEPYDEHAAAPLTLAGWVAWSTGDRPMARLALDHALRSDPDYVFARLLHRAFNEGVDPEPLRRCMRKEREARQAQEQHGSADSAACGAP
ncbi:DUF4192 domain-containing protein [Streptomyces marispadix]|uniref:DUF4192 domain-containing protein n=1 Tax=Streptomyces marispadix TaxID=2922868 RepID=A0ABS9T3C6_9ACTN|nr:DUF4192 domain-containing protein [Streptomyces marispadix]MCH6163038.1 DUF4192 domain-containing protein [Streptomyces marispadix]